MQVLAVDDINLKILRDTEGREGQYILWPNSVRRDIPMDFSMPAGTKISRKPFKGTLDQGQKDAER